MPPPTVPTPVPSPSSSGVFNASWECTALPDPGFSNTSCIALMGGLNFTGNNWETNITHCLQALPVESACVLACDSYGLTNSSIPLNYFGRRSTMLATLNFSSPYALALFMNTSNYTLLPLTVEKTWWGLANESVVNDPVAGGIPAYPLTAEVLAFYLNVITNVIYSGHATILSNNYSRLMNKSCVVNGTYNMNTTTMSTPLLVDALIRFLSYYTTYEFAVPLLNYYCFYDPTIDVVTNDITACLNYFSPLIGSNATDYQTRRVNFSQTLFHLLHNYNQQFIGCIDPKPGVTRTDCFDIVLV